MFRSLKGNTFVRFLQLKLLYHMERRTELRLFQDSHAQPSKLIALGNEALKSMKSLMGFLTLYLKTHSSKTLVM